MSDRPDWDNQFAEDEDERNARLATKRAIEVANKREAEMVRVAMGDPAARALVVMLGALLGLESDRSRLRVMSYVKDYFAERDAREADVALRAGGIQIEGEG